MATIARRFPRPLSPSARRSVCGIGAMKSMWPGCAKASTELVPRMNITQMIGEAIQTERPMLDAGDWLSPAKMAMYSRPESPPTIIWPKSASEIIVRGGRWIGSGT